MRFMNKKRRDGERLQVDEGEGGDDFGFGDMDGLNVVGFILSNKKWKISRLLI